MHTPFPFKGESHSWVCAINWALERILVLQWYSFPASGKFIAKQLATKTKRRLGSWYIFCFIVCSQQTHFIPESGHPGKLLQLLHWREHSVCNNTVQKYQKDLEACSKTDKQIELPPLHSYIQKHYREKPSNDRQTWKHVSELMSKSDIILPYRRPIEPCQSFGMANRWWEECSDSLRRLCSYL